MIEQGNEGRYGRGHFHSITAAAEVEAAARRW